MGVSLRELWMFETPNDPAGPYAHLTKLGAFVDLCVETDRWYALREIYDRFLKAEPCGQLTFNYQDFLRAVRYWGFRVQDRPRANQERYAHLPKTSHRRFDHYIARRTTDRSWTKAFGNPKRAKSKNGLEAVGHHKGMQKFITEYIRSKGAVTVDEIQSAFFVMTGEATTKSVVRSVARNVESFRLRRVWRDERYVELIDPVPYGLPLLTKMSHVFAAVRFPIALELLHEKFEKATKLKLSRKRFIEWALKAGVDSLVDFDPITHRMRRMACLVQDGMVASAQSGVCSAGQ
jgi:hypothetical protein